MTFIPHFLQSVLDVIRGIIDIFPFPNTFKSGSRAGRRITTPASKFSIPTDI